MTEESIVAVFRGLKGRTSDTVYDLFFTDRRVVAAIVLAPSDFLDMYEKRDVIDIAIGNWGKQRAKKIRSLDLIDERRAAFENKNAEEILTLHKANLAIDYENIASAKTRKGFLGTHLEFILRAPTERKIEFSIEENRIAEVEGVLTRVLSDKLK
jgi:hypothetical protein